MNPVFWSSNICQVQELSTHDDKVRNSYVNYALYEILIGLVFSDSK